MGQLVHIPFEEESSQIKDVVTDYWTDRALSFHEQRIEELKNSVAARYLAEFVRCTDGRQKLIILDAGCGAGFFEVLLGNEGHAVTGIDLTEEMVKKASELIRSQSSEPSRVKVLVMDAEEPEFPDESFDVVITRNLTWTLPHPVEAYRSWFRVLKKGGILLNIDAEYAKGAHNLKLPENRAHRLISDEMKDRCHEIYHMLTISNLDRPEWDLAVLKEIGFSQAEADLSFGERIFPEKEQNDFYVPDRVFLIRAVK